MPIQQFFSYIMGIRPSKTMFWFSDNGFQKKGKVGMVFIFCVYFQRFKKHNANQFNSTILANKQHNSVYSERFGYSNRHLLHQVNINERVVVFSNLLYVRKITHEYTLA